MSNLSKTGHSWPWEKKYEVATQLLACGNQRLVSSLTKVPYETISAWKKADWWEELVLQIRQQQTLKMDNKLTAIIEKSLDVVMDRLEKGEVVIDQKTKQQVRKPVVLRDASKAANDLLARQAIIRKTLDDTPEKSETMQDTLKKLAGEFAKFNRQVSKASATTIEYTEVVDALDEKREA